MNEKVVKHLANFAKWKDWITNFIMVNPGQTTLDWRKLEQREPTKIWRWILGQNLSLVPHSHARSSLDRRNQNASLVLLENWLYKLSNGTSFEPNWCWEDHQLRVGKWKNIDFGCKTWSKGEVCAQSYSNLDMNDLKSREFLKLYKILDNFLFLVRPSISKLMGILNGIWKVKQPHEQPILGTQLYGTVTFNSWSKSHIVKWNIKLHMA